MKINGNEATIFANIKGGEGGTVPVSGKSAYEVAVDNGFVGTEEQWLASLQGEDGGYYEPTLIKNSNTSYTLNFSPVNIQGGIGKGFFLNIPAGQDGTTPHIGENGNWFIGGTDTGVPAGGDSAAGGIIATITVTGMDEDGKSYSGTSDINGEAIAAAAANGQAVSCYIPAFDMRFALSCVDNNNGAEFNGYFDMDGILHLARIEISAAGDASAEFIPYKTADFIVNITENPDDISQYIVDKTLDELYAAYAAGKTCKASYQDNVILDLNVIYPGEIAIFSCIIADYELGVSIILTATMANGTNQCIIQENVIPNEDIINDMIDAKLSAIPMAEEASF